MQLAYTKVRDIYGPASQTLAQQAYDLGGGLPIQQQFEYTSLELFYSHEQNSKNIEISKISRHG